MKPGEALAIAEKWVTEHKGPEYRVDPEGVHQTNHGWNVGFDVPDENGVVRASGKSAKHGVEVHVLGTCTELAEGVSTVQPPPWQPVYDPELVRIVGMTSDPNFTAVVGWVPTAGGDLRPNPARVPRQGERPSTPIERFLNYVESGWFPENLIGHNVQDCEVLIPGKASIKAFDYPETLEVYTSEGMLPAETQSWHRISFGTFLTKVMADIDFDGQKPAYLHINPGLRYDRKLRCRDFADDAAEHLLMCGCGHRPTFREEHSPWIGKADIAVLDRIIRSGPVDAVPVRTVKVEFTLGVDDQGRRFVVREQPKWEPKFDIGRLRGCLVAGAIGDALGANTENLPMEVVYERHGPQGITDLPEEAHITDDTQMTLFTFEAVIRSHVSERITGLANFAHVMQNAYQRWLHTQKTPWAKARGVLSTEDEPDGWLITHRDLFRMRAPGLTCTSALQEFAKTGVHSTREKPVNNSKGCGGAMRVAPIALVSHDDKVPDVFYRAVEAAALTHGHPSGYLSAGVFAVLVQQALLGKGLHEGLDNAIQWLVRCEGHEEVVAAIEHAIELAELKDPSVAHVEELGRGGVGETALAIALYAALVTDDPNEALLISVNHGGDSDSTASMCGNLVGALHGIDKIRPDWVERVQFRDVIDQMVDDWLVENAPNAPKTDEWLTRYPPS